MKLRAKSFGGILNATKRRTVILLTVFALFASYLAVNLFKIQYLGYEYYSKKAYDQITTSSALRANRGNIYDANMDLLATNKTVWRIFVSTRE